MATTQINNMKILKILGSGASGDVFLCEK